MRKKHFVLLFSFEQNIARLSSDNEIFIGPMNNSLHLAKKWFVNFI